PIAQATPSVQGSPAQPNVAASPIATGDISTCTTCNKVKSACGSKFNLPKVNSQGTYIASDKCYCSYEVYNYLLRCLTCYNSANVGNSTLDSLDDWSATCIALGSSLDQNNTTQSNQTDRSRKSRKIGDYNPDISKPTKSLDIVDDYKRKTKYSNQNNDNQFKKNDTKQNDIKQDDIKQDDIKQNDIKQNDGGVMIDVNLNDQQQQPHLSAPNDIKKEIPQEYDQYDDETIGQAILPVAAAPEIITIIPEVHIIDENSIINFSDNIIDSQLQQQQYYYSSEQQQHIDPNGSIYYSSESQLHMDPNENIYYI
ncbi:3848_t:CDS:2, partial [Dentiscutata heterogama]